MVTLIIAIRFSRFQFWISLIAATSISVEAPPLSGLHRTTAPPLERRRSSSRPGGAPASFPHSAASLNSNSSAASLLYSTASLSTSLPLAVSLLPPILCERGAEWIR